jgi:hypothetical protein
VDRRTALKKLAAGGAIAAGGSMVLSSNAVAQTCSNPVVPPAAGAAFTRQLVSNQMQLVPTAAMSAVVVPTYAWRIRSYANMGANRGLRIRQTGAGGFITQSTTSTNCAAPCQTTFAGGPGDVTVSRFNIGSQTGNLALRNTSASTYAVEAQVTWNKPGCPPVVAVYRFSGAGRGLPTVTLVP